MKKINVGIIGSGKIVSWFLNDLEHNKYKENIIVKAIFTLDEKSGKEYCDKYNIDGLFLDKEEFKKEHFDIVYIGTPDCSHVSLSKEMLGNGFNVWCEKPIAATKKEAEEIYSLAESKNLLFYDGIKNGTSPAYMKMKEDIRNGLIGDVLLIHSTFTKISTSGKIPNPGPEMKLSGFQGSLLYAAFLPLDIAGPIKEMNYFANSFKNNPSIEHVSVIARHNNSVLSTMTASSSTTDNSTAVIQGTKGYITLGGQLDKYNKPYKKDSIHMAYTYRLYDLQSNLIKEVDLPFETSGEGLVKEQEHIYELLISNSKISNIMTKEISIGITELLEWTSLPK